MPWYECPRCRSQEAFFQREQNFQNGIEAYTDHTGRTNFRNSLSVSDVDIPYCRKCMVVKMNAFMTPEEIRKRNRIRVLYGLGLLIVFLLVFGYSGNSSRNSSSIGSSLNSSSVGSTQTIPQNESIYASDLNGDGSHEIDRNVMADGVNDCGISLPEEVFTIDSLIPSSWRLLEFNGCGSGSTYEWINSDNESEIIRIEFHSDAGWCSELGSEDYESAVMDRVLGYGEEIQEFSSIENSEMAKYRYLKTALDGISMVLGVIRVGTDSDFCGNGDFRVEAALVDTEAALFESAVRAVF